MSKEKQMFEDLVEIFEEEYEKRRLITPQNTAEKMTAKGYRKQSEGEWVYEHSYEYLEGTDAPLDYKCSLCGLYATDMWAFCPNCGARMKGGEADA